MAVNSMSLSIRGRMAKK